MFPACECYKYKYNERYISLRVCIMSYPIISHHILYLFVYLLLAVEQKMPIVDSSKHLQTSLLNISALIGLVYVTF